MTSPFEELRKVRQSRKFTDEPVTDEQLATLLEVAQWTGSSQNTQPWHFIVIRDKEQLEKVSAVRDDPSNGRLALRWRSRWSFPPRARSAARSTKDVSPSGS